MVRLSFLLFIAIASCAGLSAKEIAVGPQVSGFLDTEATTNVAFSAVRNDVRVFDVRIEMASSVSNSVQVAFGRDADGDGELALEETGLTLGWRGGRCCVENVPLSQRIYGDSVPVHGQDRFLRLRVATDCDLVPVRATITNETGACFTAVSEAAPAWLFRPEWNLMRVTRRGVVVSDEWCRILCDYSSFSIRVR